MKNKSFIFFILILFSFTFSAQELFLEWAVPIKKNLTQLNKREQGGVVVMGEDILVSTRSGDLHLFSKRGNIKKTIHFDGEFTISPEVLENGNVLVCISNNVILLDKKLKELWNVKGKAPVASTPLHYKDFILVQFHDNSIYVIDYKNGTIKSAFTDFSEEEVSFLRLSKPVEVEDKIVFGFSNGTIIFFMIRKTGQNEELIPYYRFKTSKSTRSFDKKDFFDVLTVIPHKDTVMFSSGEYGGIIVEGKPSILDKMRNLTLIKNIGEGYTGYGEGGIFRFDEEGIFLSRPFISKNYVTNLISEKEYSVFTTTGEGTMIGYNEGYVYLFSHDFEKKFHSIMIPNGVSAKAAIKNKSVYVISDMGVVYKFNIVK